MTGLFKGFRSFFRRLFFKRKNLKIGIYGPPNGGKTTLANRICEDWLGEELGKVSPVAHETREMQLKEQVHIKSGKKELIFNLIDTPGIATKEAKQRAKEATKGVIDAIQWLDDMDIVIVVIDSSKDPYTQVNLTIIGNLEARKIPMLVVANKIDLKKSDIKKIEAAFPRYRIVGISAKFGNNIEDFYKALINISFI